MPDTTAQAVKTTRTKTAKERYAILLPLSSVDNVYKVYTGNGRSYLQQVSDNSDSFKPDRQPMILASAIADIIFGMTLGSEFYASSIKHGEKNSSIATEVYIYESLAGKRQWLGTVAEFALRQQQKTATD